MKLSVSVPGLYYGAGKRILALAEGSHDSELAAVTPAATRFARGIFSFWFNIMGNRDEPGSFRRYRSP